MSTRCRIAMKLNNGYYRSVYCHYDGYPDGVWMILRQHYDSVPEARMVIKAGDLSSLEEDAINSYQDRGESWQQVKPITSPDLPHLIKTAAADHAEYIHCHEQGCWKIISMHKPFDKTLRSKNC